MKIKEIITNEGLEDIKRKLLSGEHDIINLAEKWGINDRIKIRHLRSYLIKKYSFTIDRVDRKNNWTEEELKELSKYLSENKSYKEISELFIGRHTIQSIVGAVRTHKTLRYTGTKRRQLKDNQQSEIIKKARSGKYSITLLRWEYRDLTSKMILHIIKQENLVLPGDFDLGVLITPDKKLVTGLTKQNLPKLIESGKTIVEIAKAFGISKDSVKRRLNYFHISLIKRQKKEGDKRVSLNQEKIYRIIKNLFNREPTTQELNTKSFQTIITKELLEKIYLSNNKSAEKTANYIGISKSLVTKLINVYGIKQDTPLRLKDYPIEFYKNLVLVEKLSYGEIADIIGFKKDTVRKYINKIIPESKRSPNGSSIGEEITLKILEELNLQFEPQKCYHLDANNPKQKFFIDFVILFNNKEYWIEYNGKQHYNFVPYFYGGDKEAWYHQVERDKTVRKYCKDNCIPLLEIPYTMETTESIRHIITEIILNNKPINEIINFNGVKIDDSINLKLN